MNLSFFEKLVSDEEVVMCVHCVQNPDELKYVYRSEADVITCVCDRDDDMSVVENFRWAHAKHMVEKFPALSALEDLPLDCVAMLYFDPEPKWVVETLIDSDD